MLTTEGDGIIPMTEYIETIRKEEKVANENFLNPK